MASPAACSPVRLQRTRRGGPNHRQRAEGLRTVLHHEIPQDLLEALQKDEIALVVGTGVTIRSTGTAQASWTALLQAGIRECEVLGRVDSSRADTMRRELGSGHVDDFLSVGEKITRAFGGPLSGDFALWLRGRFADATVVETDVLDAIRDITHRYPQTKIITTNYDQVLDKHLNWPSVTWTSGPDRAQRVLRGREHGVIHIHGCWDDPQSVVLGTSSYENLLRNAVAVNLLRAAATMRTLVFVGFGAGLKDPTFVGLLSFLKDALERSTFRNFRLVRDSELQEAVKENKPAHRLIALPFGAGHHDLAPYLRRLRAEAQVASGRRGVSGRSKTPRPARRPFLVEDSAGIDSAVIATDFYGAVDWEGLFSQSSSVDLFFTYAYTWRHLFGEAIDDFVGRPGTQLRVVLPDLRSETATAEIAKRAGQEQSTLRQRVSEAIDYFLQRQVELRLHDAAQTYTAYRFDDVVVVAVYPHRRGPVQDVPTLLIQADSAAGAFFIEDFEAVWEMSWELTDVAGS